MIKELKFCAVITIITLILTSNFLLLVNSKATLKDNTGALQDKEIDKKIKISEDIEKEKIKQNLAKMKGFFTKNQGQLENDEIYFTYSASDKSFGFCESSVLIKLTKTLEDNSTKSSIIKITFENSNKVIPVGKNELIHKSNYFIGNEPSNWKSNVPNYEKIVYENLYDGIDLIYYFNENGLKYDWVVKPYANPKEIVERFEGIGSINIDSQGALIIKTEAGEFREKKPYSYQKIFGNNVDIEMSFKLIDYHSLKYNIGDYDSSNNLIIDPLIYSTYIGGKGWHDSGRNIVVDNDNNAYIIGNHNSSAFPTTPGCFDDTLEGYYTDIFVSKLNSDGSDLIYSTYMGGSGWEFAGTITLDSENNAYVTGVTTSENFPTTLGCFDNMYDANYDGFVFKLNQNGTDLIYSTYVGGDENDGTGTIILDTENNAYINGYTLSSDFPTTPGCYDSSYSGLYDGFVLKLNSNGTNLIHSTFYGGSAVDHTGDMALDTENNVYVTGNTLSSDFPTTTGCYDNTLNGIRDVYLFKLNSNLSSLLYSTYIGGDNEDASYGIVLDSLNNAYISGRTNSSNFPTTSGCYDNSYNGGERDVFVLKFNIEGSDLLYSTFVGGSDYDSGGDMAFDSWNNVYVIGQTKSTDFPTTPNCYDSSYNGDEDIFVITLNQDCSSLLYSTYFGADNFEICSRIAIDTENYVYIIGQTKSTDFPTTLGCFDDSHNGGYDAFTFKLEVDLPQNLTITELYAGWNLVSIPENQSISLDDIIIRYNNSDYLWDNATTNNNPIGEPIVLKFIYGWNRTEQQYDLINVLEPSYGYWIYSYYDCTLLRQLYFLNENVKKSNTLEEKNDSKIEKVGTTTWSTDKILTSNYTINIGDTLIINPGVTVYLDEDVGIFVNGILKAEGEENNLIKFTHKDEGEYWDRIRFEHLCVDGECIMKYCKIEYAGAGIALWWSSPTIINNKILNCLYDGIITIASSSKIENNTIINCSNYGIYAYGSTLTILYNDISNCGSAIALCFETTISNIVKYNTLTNNSWHAIYLFFFEGSNTITNNYCYGNKETIKVYNCSGDNIFKDNIVLNSTLTDYLLIDNSILTIINSTLNKAIVDSTSKLYVKNYLEINVKDIWSNPIENADVKVKDNSNVIYASSGYGSSNSQTDSNGLISGILVTDRVYDGSNIATENITNVSVKYKDWEEINGNVNMSTSHTEVFVFPGIYITSLKIEWNLIGIPLNQSISLDYLIVSYNGTYYIWEDATSNNNSMGTPIILKFVYSWNRTIQQYELVSELLPGYGYWMYAYYNCTLFRQIYETTTTINKNQILPIDFTWESKSQKSTTTVQFEATITTPPNRIGESKSSQYNIISWYWNFADLGLSNEQNPSFTFDYPGIYPITLTVWNEDGISDSVTYNIKIFGTETNQSFTSIEYAQANTYSDSTIGNNQVAQSFISSTSNLETLSLYLSSRYNKPTTAIIEIQTNAKHQYDGDILSNIVIASTQISFSKISSSSSWIDFDIDINLIFGQKYWIVLKDDDLESASEYIIWWQKYEWTGNGETYPDGEKAYSPNNGIDWYSNKLGDRFFKINAYSFTIEEVNESKEISTVTHSKKDDETNNTTPNVIIEDKAIETDIVGDKCKDEIPQPNNELPTNETEENSLSNEINEENYYNSIFLIKASIVIITFLIFAVLVRKKFKLK